MLCAERHDDHGAHLVVACNATKEPRSGYLVGLAVAGEWSLRCSSDERRFGGAGRAVPTAVTATAGPWQGRPFRAALELPPLGFVIYGPGRVDSVPGDRGRVH